MLVETATRLRSATPRATRARRTEIPTGFPRARRPRCIQAITSRVIVYSLSRREYDRCIAETEAEQAEEAEAEEAVAAAPALAAEPGDLRLAALLGKGGFGRVLLVEHAPTKKVLALKAMSKKAVTDANQAKTLLAERSCIAKFESGFIVACHGAFQDRDFVYLCLEYCSGGDLYSFMRAPRATDGPRRRADAKNGRGPQGTSARGSATTPSRASSAA